MDMRLLLPLLAVPAALLADPDITLSGAYTTDQDFTVSSDTTVHLAGATFTDCCLKLRGDRTFTLHLVDGTRNVFTMDGLNKEPIKATKASNIVLTGGGSLEVSSTKRITDSGKPSGVLVCNNLTVAGGDTKVVFGNDKSDTACILLKGDYLQTGGSLKVDASKKNCTNEFVGVQLDAGHSFTLLDGRFRAEIAGIKSRAVNLKKSGQAVFAGGETRCAFEGPMGRFVNGGTISFTGGSHVLTTNVTAKMTADYMPDFLSAVKADYSISISGGDFTADLPLPGSEVFTTDSETGTSIDISGGVLDLVAGDDCISANGDISVSGGVIRGVSVFDDVLDANGDMTVSGGFVQAWATAPGTHGLDVNRRHVLRIAGGVLVATDGVDGVPIGTAGSSEVGTVDFVQPTCYRTLQTDAYAGRLLSLAGVTNGVPFACAVRLPELPAGRNFNLLVSVPGRGTDVPRPVGGPEFADPAADGVAAIAVKGDVVEIGVRTLPGLSYGLLFSDDLRTWTPVGGPVRGTGGICILTAPRAGDRAFFRVTMSD